MQHRCRAVRAGVALRILAGALFLSAAVFVGCGDGNGRPAPTPTATQLHTVTPEATVTATSAPPLTATPSAIATSTASAVATASATPVATSTPPGTPTAVDMPTATPSAAVCNAEKLCAEIALCELPEGVCGGPAEDGVCVAVPSYCSDPLQPVCGCDGLTYGSDCLRRAARVQKAEDAACAAEECGDACDCYATRRFAATCPLECATCDNYWICSEGHCLERCGAAPAGVCEKFCSSNDACGENDFCGRPVGGCALRGACVPRPEVCPDVIDPVCGCDGVTYDNQCEAAQAGVVAEHDGACAVACGGFAGMDCPDSQFCEYAPGICGGADLSGTCVDVGVPCPLFFDPVCGCDGQTYDNDCVRRNARAQLDHRGDCAAQ